MCVGGGGGRRGDGGGGCGVEARVIVITPLFLRLKILRTEISSIALQHFV